MDERRFIWRQQVHVHRRCAEFFPLIFGTTSKWDSGNPDAKRVSYRHRTFDPESDVLLRPDPRSAIALPQYQEYQSSSG
jgi:hypothetical protein